MNRERFLLLSLLLLMHSVAFASTGLELSDGLVLNVSADTSPFLR